MLKILVPTDYSPEAKNASLYAYQLALNTNSSLLLYHAIPAVVPVTDIPFENYYLDEEEEKTLLLEGFKEFLIENQLDPNQVVVEAVVSTQNLVAQGIKETFQKNDCDLVIMGTHGASGFRKILFGSNTVQLITISDFPLLAIPKGYLFNPIYHLVFASDLSSLEEELSVLVTFAEIFHAVLEIFYFDYAGPESENLILEAENYIINHQYKNIRLTIKKGNGHQTVAENLKGQIDAGSTQMLVMYRAEHNWLDSLLNPGNTIGMVSDPKLPILVLHKNPSAN